MSGSKAGTVHGVLLLDKDKGITSNKALQRAKRALGATRAGHCGTLDPMATGMLICAFGYATRWLGELLHADKEYLTTFRFGTSTATGDLDGEVLKQESVERVLSQVTQESIDELAEATRGVQMQVPPMYSATKRNGVPLYELARQGKEIEREPREICVHKLDILGIDGTDVHVNMRVSKGTYVRSIAMEWGEKLGVGACVYALRRSGVGFFSEQGQELVTQADIDAAKEEGGPNDLLMPVDALLLEVPVLEVTSDDVNTLRMGCKVALRELAEPGRVRLIEKGSKNFVGIAEVNHKAFVQPKRLIPAR